MHTKFDLRDVGVVIEVIGAEGYLQVYINPGPSKKKMPGMKIILDGRSVYNSGNTPDVLTYLTDEQKKTFQELGHDVTDEQVYDAITNCPSQVNLIEAEILAIQRQAISDHGGRMPEASLGRFQDLLLARIYRVLEAKKLKLAETTT